MSKNELKIVSGGQTGLEFREWRDKIDIVECCQFASVANPNVANGHFKLANHSTTQLVN